MEKVTVLSHEKLFNGWIDPKYLPDGKDKYYIRNKQVRKPRGGWRHLTSSEIERLVKNDNSQARKEPRLQVPRRRRTDARL